MERKKKRLDNCLDFGEFKEKKESESVRKAIRTMLKSLESLKRDIAKKKGGTAHDKREH